MTPKIAALAFPVLVALSAPGRPAGAPAPKVSIQTLRYGTGPTMGHPEGMPLMLDLYVPKQCRPKCPVLVALHGGSFRLGARDIDEQKEYGRLLGSRGFAVASVSYRLQGDWPLANAAYAGFADTVRRADYPPVRNAVATRGVDYPIAVAAAVEDAGKAIAWLRRSGRKHGIDSERIGLLGASAGAMAVLSLAYLSDDNRLKPPPIKAVISVRGMILNERSAQSPAPMRARDPPLFIVHGTSDDRVANGEAWRLYGYATAAKVAVQIVQVGGAGHELGGQAMLTKHVDGGTAVIDDMVTFLDAAFASQLPAGFGKCTAIKAPCSPPQ